ncbi:MAG: HPr kinase/phosphatase C-terminal domain-containing protein [OCS116 cluster bacterium]|nr:HPr kinase/phosphatase C-terminal domain-containing protein [OCS116 cluster bacterium]
MPQNTTEIIDSNSHIMHATSIFLDGFGILIGGPSGIGKSALALDLLNDAHGFDYVLLNSGSNLLIADDQTHIGRDERGAIAKIVARCPQNIEGMLEVRGLGIIKVPFKSPAPIDLYVEIVDQLPERMPEAKDQFRYILNVKTAYIQIHKNDRLAKARVRAALYAHTRAKLV